ncbi:hypothetical protein [Amycolatopsis sp. FDAARGOS 1241]|uniref:hypothetical protein n=1 Tax=Amycolatopsis sp. FDAARGOS 1241 TaxID=2778070 RepID=UPI00194F988D|nr:hypothetical protein [Amycolatopsis sp. FDAARGOS 1241]QRP48190.1 hypothetical protein I6J71_10095 [Amycolatopsis sp. FDAARGOS 1241]
MDVDQLRKAPVKPYEDGVPVLRVVDVLGRKSGEPRPAALNVTELDGLHYVCAPASDRDWVRNLLAAGYCRVERDGPDARDTVRRVSAATPDEAARVLAAQRRTTESPFAVANSADAQPNDEPDQACEEPDGPGQARTRRAIVLRLDALN